MASLVRIFVGVDGGGSRCRVRVVDSRGIERGRAIGASANVYLDFDRALATIRGTVTEALGSAGVAADAIAGLGLGLAGVSSPAIGERVRAALADLPHVTVTNDGEIACLGAHAGQDGGLVIAGTGSAAVLRLDGRSVNLGGRGFLLGDDGSGAQIGRDAWRKALRAHDALEPQTPLLQRMMAEFGDDPVAVIAWGRQAPSHDFARYAPLVFEAAAAGDAAGLALRGAAVRSIGELIQALRDRGAARICLVGGLAAAFESHLSPAARSLLSPPVDDALHGALLMAGLHL